MALVSLYDNLLKIGLDPGSAIIIVQSVVVTSSLSDLTTAEPPVAPSASPVLSALLGLTVSQVNALALLSPAQLTALAALTVPQIAAIPTITPLPASLTSLGSQLSVGNKLIAGSAAGLNNALATMYSEVDITAYSCRTDQTGPLVLGDGSAAFTSEVFFGSNSTGSWGRLGSHYFPVPGSQLGAAMPTQFAFKIKVPITGAATGAAGNVIGNLGATLYRLVSPYAFPANASVVGVSQLHNFTWDTALSTECTADLDFSAIGVVFITGDRYTVGVTFTRSAGTAAWSFVAQGCSMDVVPIQTVAASPFPVITI